MKISNRCEGFTLIEVMIVVVIIAILAAIVIPNYQNYVMRTQLSRAFSEIGSLRAAVEICEADGALGTSCEFDTVTSSLYLTNPTVSFNPSEIYATFNNKVSLPLRGGNIALKRNETTGWVCTMSFTNNVPSYIIPKGCTLE